MEKQADESGDPVPVSGHISLRDMPITTGIQCCSFESGLRFPVRVCKGLKIQTSPVRTYKGPGGKKE